MKIEGTRIKCMGYDATLECLYYSNNRRVIRAMCDDKTPLGILTVNLPDSDLDKNELLIKTWSKNKELARIALQTGLFIDTGKRVITGYTEAEVWKLAEGVTIN